MTRRLPVGRDTAILLAVVLGALSAVALLPPSGAPPTASAASMSGSRRADVGQTTTGSSHASGSGGSTAGTGSGGTSTSTGADANRTKLKNTPYAQYAYLVSGRTLSAKAKRALDGFEWNRTRVNASAIRITLVPTESRYRRHSVVVPTDHRLYFVETSRGDDAPQREAALGDDGLIEVDHRGYVVR